MTIRLENLKDMRESKGWTREVLSEESGVSIRHIARIESARHPVQVRRSTIERLSDALGVDTTSASLDISSEFSGTRLKTVRQRLGMSRAQLSKASNVSVRQISRLEDPQEDIKPRRFTVERLARALEVKPITLTNPDEAGWTAVPMKWRTHTSKLPPQVAMAYDLVRLRYGIGTQEIVKLAPMLFVVLAESCRLWREKLLADMIDRLEYADELMRHHPHLWFGFMDDRDDWGIHAERESINQHDLVGKLAAKGVEEEYNADLANGITPFLNYIRHLTREINDPDLLDLNEIGLPHNFGFKWYANDIDETGYKLFAKRLDEITGGSEIALLALQSGDAQIADIPEELMAEETSSERVAWLESRLSDEVRDTVSSRRANREWIRGMQEIYQRGP